MEFIHNHEWLKLDESAFLGAAINNINAVDWFLQNNFEWPKNTISYCIEHDCNLKIIKQIISRGCPIEPKSAAKAAEFGKLGILKWLHSNHQLPLHGVVEQPIKDYSQFSDENNNVIFNAASIAAVNGNVKCLKYAFENGCPFHPQTTWNIAGNLNENSDWKFKVNQIFKCLEYIVDNGCPIDKDTSFTAFSNEDLRLLRFLHSKGALQISEDIKEYLNEVESTKMLDFINEIMADKSLKNKVSNDIVKNLISSFM